MGVHGARRFVREPVAQLVDQYPVRKREDRGLRYPRARIDRFGVIAAESPFGAAPMSSAMLIPSPLL